jgi:FixJ family two-component response regulator
LYDAAPCVRVVDDDASVLKALGRLLRSAGFAVRTFPSPQNFLREYDAAAPGCVVLDLSMPGLDGLQIQRALTVLGDDCPIVFITGRGDIASSVSAMKAGAVDFLTKPFDASRLLDAVRAAVAKDRSAREARAERSSIGVRMAALTPREREVMAQVCAGRLNKQIAADLGIAEKTVKVHRARVMKKMAAGSVAELVQLVGATRVSSAPA